MLNKELVVMLNSMPLVDLVEVSNIVYSRLNGALSAPTTTPTTQVSEPEPTPATNAKVRTYHPRTEAYSVTYKVTGKAVRFFGESGDHKPAKPANSALKALAKAEGAVWDKTAQVKGLEHEGAWVFPSAQKAKAFTQAHKSLSAEQYNEYLEA